MLTTSSMHQAWHESHLTFYSIDRSTCVHEFCSVAQQSHSRWETTPAPSYRHHLSELLLFPLRKTAAASRLCFFSYRPHLAKVPQWFPVHTHAHVCITSAWTNTGSSPLQAVQASPAAHEPGRSVKSASGAAASHTAWPNQLCQGRGRAASFHDSQAAAVWYHPLHTGKALSFWCVALARALLVPC